MSETGMQVVDEELVALRAAFVDTATRFAARDVASRIGTLDTVTLVAEEYATLRAALVEAGLLGMLAPESAGGMGMDPGSVGPVLSRIAEGCAGTAMLMWAHESALLALANAATHGDAALDDVGEDLLGNGLVSDHSLRAMRRGEGWQINGSAGFVWGAGVAGHAVVAAETDEGGIIALVPAGAPGWRLREQHARIGLRACPSAAFVFDGVKVEQAIALSGVDFAATVAQSRRQSLALVGAIACGNARGALRRAVAYARERYQGGAVIIEHALVRGMLGKSLADLRAAEALVDAALARGGDDLVLAKVVATRHGEQLCLDAVQVFGGNGYMRDYGVEKHLRDARMLCLVGGNNDRLLQAVVDTHKHEGDWP